VRIRSRAPRPPRPAGRAVAVRVPLTASSIPNGLHFALPRRRRYEMDGCGNGRPGCYRGASGRLRGEASVVSMACSVGIPPAWWMRRRYSLTCSFIRRSAGRTCVSTRSRVRLAAPPPVGADSVAVNRVVAAACIRARAQRRLRPAGWVVAIVACPRKLKAHRSVYNQSKALYAAISAQNARCTWPRWEAQHMAVAPTGGQWVAQP
jgi:hypothetical protein